MPTKSSSWIQELPRSPVKSARKPVAADGTAGDEAFGNNQSNGGGGRPSAGVLPLRHRIGDIFRTRLKLAGAAALRSFSGSFPQDCPIHADEESTVSPATPAKHGPDKALPLDGSTMVNERPVARPERPFTDRTSTLIGASSSSSGATGSAILRARRSSTISRQRTVHRTPSSGSPKLGVDDATVEGETGYSEQHQQKQQQPRKEDQSKPKLNETLPVAAAPSRMVDYHHPGARSLDVPPQDGAGRPGKVDGLGRGAAAPPVILAANPVDEIVVGKPPSHRERINSTSHYSTEKSGSSGYYSTNVYSTGGSSVDEHIYCEPIDRRPQPADQKTSHPATGNACAGGTVAGHLVRKRRATDQEAPAELQHSVGRGLEQYYYPASSLAVPAHPVQLSVLRAATTNQQQQPALASPTSLEVPGSGPGCSSVEQPLSIIMEGTDGQIPRPIWPLDIDDSLMDINLESFRMAEHSSQNLIGFESPALSSISDNEVYREGSGPPPSGPAPELPELPMRKKSQYEEYLEFHNTRNILEQIRGKLNTLLEQRADQQQQQQDPTKRISPSHGTNPFTSASELERNIAVLKADLDGYLRTMNQKNESEIGRFCKGMSREPKVVAVQNAVEQRNRSRSGSILSLEPDYELLERGPPALPASQTYNTSSGEASFLPYYQVLAPEGRPPAALPASVVSGSGVYGGTALLLNRRSPPNPFAQEVRSSQLLQTGMAATSDGGLHSLGCNQRFLNNDEIRVCSRYGGCERTADNVAIDMPDGVDDDDDSYVGPYEGRSVSCCQHHAGDERHSDSRSVSIGMPECDPDDHKGPLGVTVGHGAGGARRTVRISDGGSEEGKRNGDSGGSESGDRQMAHCDFSQLQRNITLERIILMESLGKARTGQFIGDKEKMLLEWHQNKPSCWELYYGANREEHKPHQSLIRKMKLGRKSTVCISYPSTRPESDFTLDVPRAEQLRLKMKKEKQLRSRCRWFFYFLSVVFFLLSVMVVSLVLTRGKRMFGSMI
ncbi:uncharacterized protein LOC128279094 [Anopheles cruzii]|uniref:uncharacterized protein LOC128279094 n=1 Tax=Anopheles cruzii TaxID=68878 RepID=UPI0022EC5A42|nr:uncharacterized protein LOC128279094 [Anopheles cruzii]